MSISVLFLCIFFSVFFIACFLCCLFYLILPGCEHQPALWWPACPPPAEGPGAGPGQGLGPGRPQVEEHKHTIQCVLPWRFNFPNIASCGRLETRPHYFAFISCPTYGGSLQFLALDIQEHLFNFLFRSQDFTEQRLHVPCLPQSQV